MISKGFPYKEYENSELWKVVHRAIGELVENSDIQETTDRTYVVGYICKALCDSEINKYSELLYCPAKEKYIDYGLCWEYCFAENGAPSDTGNELKDCIINSGRFKSIEEFHKKCENCIHCQWDK